MPDPSTANHGSNSPGEVIVIPTPIGNLGDASARMREAILSCNILACEDTRVSRSLIDKLHLKLPESVRFLSHREENEKSSAEALIAMVKSGDRVGLLCDAGTPGLSDPGFRLVRLARSVGIKVTPLPGPFAGATALSASGLPTDGFWFLGFLPPKTAARRRFLEDNRKFPHTIILYESVHRIEKFLQEIVEVLGQERTIAVARELTKMHESFSVGKASEVRDMVLQAARKGEFVVMIAKEGFSLDSSPKLA